MPNQQKILNYIEVYRSILDGHGSPIAPTDVTLLYQLINLIFEIDRRYERGEELPDRVERNSLEKTMGDLFPPCLAISEPAIDRFFVAMERESKFSTEYSLIQYLEISGDSIGSHLLSSQLACFLKIPAEIWLSSTLTRLNGEIDRLIRLANDYLDITVDKERGDREGNQVKSGQFFPNPLAYKLYFLVLYSQHKIHYWLNRIRFQWFDRDYSRAIDLSESILQWAYRVYVIDKNSCQD